ncbi:hypothetical protein APHWI1_0299 [Anaplasma phagocytophilum str. ApWI1]|uniref:Uncharacterized protein n=3 Tax=Anaplasma phagocytophilum TaxID=948 RepID=Q2GJS4_ANAPZ|nr:hypothetical protein [Anaplasma phagocytophilum]ABD43410.1 hypothetical protein APH_0800 [Anaplasma phagocytophilum str. HZ]KJV59781.1 hypothetical protein APHWEB_1217 [Anaplasma phagocytophilum str. Webster]KJV63181.1 hypothetical protein EPHNCH_1119 [Anaplasma phagocytophilum str. NCH-1]KJV83242.1 hypothetical protein APHHGE2_1096 [Anaplasma phagocytophilum str. HGE2]KJV85458.1 hypothetical protein APHWI1_0299 [Anaplasma phagocytophilum str. ApWI1]KJV87156.1 hypothetical protein APHNYW_0
MEAQCSGFDATKDSTLLFSKFVEGVKIGELLSYWESYSSVLT